MPIKFSILTRPIKEKIRQYDHTGLNSSTFWIGHLLMIAATIIGVYLAAQAGLRQAILFDEITDLQSSYHVRSALADELQENIRLLHEYQQQFLSKQLSGQELQQNNPNLSHYVWDSMKYSPATLEIPGYFLNEVQRFYRQVHDIIQKGEQRVYAASHASRLLTVQLEHMEQQVLPRLRDNIRSVRAELNEYGITIPDDGVAEHVL